MVVPEKFWYGLLSLSFAETTLLCRIIFYEFALEYFVESDCSLLLISKEKMKQKVLGDSFLNIALTTFCEYGILGQVWHRTCQASL